MARVKQHRTHSARARTRRRAVDRDEARHLSEAYWRTRVTRSISDRTRAAAAANPVGLADGVRQALGSHGEPAEPDAGASAPR